MGSVQHRSERTWVDQHFAGRLDACGEQRLRAHLHECETCRLYYERHLLLAQLDPRALSAKQRLGHSLQLGRPKSTLWKPLMAVAAMAAAAAMLSLFILPGFDESASMQARGAAQDIAKSSIVVYRIKAGEKSLPVMNRISAADELAFAYSNPSGKKRLMIYAVDEKKHVFWYHPAWLDATTDPVAVPIVAGAKSIELPEAVGHELSQGNLDIRWLFVDEALSVTQVEAMLANQASSASSLPIADAVQGSLHVEVQPVEVQP